MLNELFRRKSVERILRESETQKMETEHGGSLKRTLRAVDLAAFGIAAIIGAGIFGTVGQAAYDGGPAVSLLFVFIAIACGFTAFCLFILVATAVAALSFVKSLSLIPVLGLLTCLYLMSQLGITNWTRFVIWLVVGLAIYFLYSRKSSKLRDA